MAIDPEQAEDQFEITGVIDSARVDKDGAWKVTLAIPMSDGPKVAALTLYTETAFKIKFSPDDKPEETGL